MSSKLNAAFFIATALVFSGFSPTFADKPSEEKSAPSKIVVCDHIACGDGSECGDSCGDACGDSCCSTDCKKKCRTLIPDWKPIIKMKIFCCPPERKPREPGCVVKLLERAFNRLPLHACGDPPPAGSCEWCEKCGCDDTCECGS